MDDYDLVIIGSGAAGASAAATAVHLGAARVAMAEQGTLWGTCVNAGCIPSKFLLTLAGMQYYRNYHHTGLSVDSLFNLPAALAEKQALIDRLKKAKHDTLVDKLGVELVQGTAEFRSPGELQVGNRVLSAKKFIIAAGSSPSVPPVEGIRDVPFITSAEALSPGHIPGSLIILGGRALGLEFAQIYSHLGTQVTVLQRSSRIIPEEEPEISDLMEGYLASERMRIRTGVDIKNVRKKGDDIVVTTTINEKDQEFSAEQLLLATGRTPNTSLLRADRAGVKIAKNGAVIVDKNLRTSAPNIWAAGDVTGEPMLETTARAGGSLG
jgi:mercuric reductase